MTAEWIETNGIGGFACSTVTGCNSRRYHGLLVAATTPPTGRMVLLSKVEETVVLSDGRRFELSVNRYEPGVLHPRGDRLLAGFRQDPFPTWIYELGEGVRLRKRVFLIYGENTTVVEYELEGDAASGAHLEVRPLVAFRDYHSTTHRNDALNPSFEVRDEDRRIRYQAYQGMPGLYFAHSAGHVAATGHWYLNFEYEMERERGLDWREDLFQPFQITLELPRAALIASTLPDRSAAQVATLRAAERNRRQAVTAAAASVAGAPEYMPRLFAAADQFLCCGNTIIAGYPWFTDWGRDTMIALPGIALVTRRYDDARRILDRFAGAVSQGMLPNRYPDFGETPEYNTADATLWYFEAVRAYLAYSGDAAFVRDRLYPVLRDILEWHLRGTRYGIVVDGDGLLRCGEPGVQLTWMDAKIGDWVVTPRHGKPVEIEALWYNALCTARDLAEQFGDDPRHRFLSGLAALAADSFRAQFWNPQRGCLYDVAGDATVRPNQIFAVSLHHTMLIDREQARAVVETVRRELFTPLGLRSLAPSDPRYAGRYGGSPAERDAAYHQGTVWQWLMGPFLTAWMKVHNYSDEARAEARQWLETYVRQLDEGCLGQIGEIADGDPPQRVHGCFAQAWSVAETLRAALEDVYVTRDPGVASN